MKSKYKCIIASLLDLEKPTGLNLQMMVKTEEECIPEDVEVEDEEVGGVAPTTVANFA